MAQFRVMTWNVENLFDVGDDDGPETQAEFNAKLDSLASAINEQEPHVLARRARSEAPPAAASGHLDLG
jgi:hypothetical protein